MSKLLIILGTVIVTLKSLTTALTGVLITGGLYVLGYAFIFLGLVISILTWAQESSERANRENSETTRVMKSEFYN